MKIYLSGKISGLHINTAKTNFKDAENSFLHGRMSRVYQNCKVINPMNLKPFLGIKMYWCYMLKDIYYLKKCTHIALMSNWKDSKGACIEHFIGKFIFKLEVIYL